MHASDLYSVMVEIDHDRLTPTSRLFVAEVIRQHMAEMATRLMFLGGSAVTVSASCQLAPNYMSETFDLSVPSLVAPDPQ